MGFPIIQEIWDGIRWLIDFFINKAPRSVQILFFLLFLLFFGTLLNFMLQIGGIHCNSEKVPVKLGIKQVSENVELLWETDPTRQIKGDELTICDVHQDKCGSERDCYYFMRELDSGGYALCNETNSSADCKYYLNDGVCHNCTDKEICIQENRFWIFCGTYYDICIDDAYFGGGQVTDFMNKCGGTCDVPENYVWNQTTGTYKCLELTLCGDNATNKNNAVDLILERAGAENLYKTGHDDFSANKLIGITCDNNLNPQLAVFRIPVFHYLTWVFVGLIYLMIIGLKYILMHR